MGKAAHDDMLDGGLLVLKNNVTKMVACTSEPTTYAEATDLVGATPAGYALADATLAATDMLITDKIDVTKVGRKLTVAEMADEAVDATGTAAHVALVDVLNEKLLYVTTCTQQELTLGNTVTFPSWTISIGNPA